MVTAKKNCNILLKLFLYIYINILSQICFTIEKFEKKISCIYSRVKNGVKIHQLMHDYQKEMVCRNYQKIRCKQI